MDMKRQVIESNEDKCVGCGLCASACMQGAIQIIDGKAKLVSDSYCDGLGMCLPKCPVDAINLVEKETAEFNPERKNIKAKIEALPVNSGCGCQSSNAQSFKPKNVEEGLKVQTNIQLDTQPQAMLSQLTQWPVQLKLVSPAAPYFENADLLIAADCTAFAYGNFHNEFIKGKITVIGCPKLDDNQANIEKLTQIFANNTIKSITVVRMEVPCCGGIIQAVRQAMLKAECIVPYNEVTITYQGERL
jgi:NAD-dependent dihydropyrimidine dehydrogenase PreA subunit